MANLTYPNMPQFYPNQNIFAGLAQPASPSGIEFRYIKGGDNGAKAFQVSPGSTFILMDSESQYFYLKGVSIYGDPQPLRKFKFEEVLESPNEALPDAKEVPNFVTKEEFNSAIDKLSSLIEDAMNQKVYFSKNRGEKRESNIRSDK